MLVCVYTRVNLSKKYIREKKTRNTRLNCIYFDGETSENASMYTIEDMLQQLTGAEMK